MGRSSTKSDRLESFSLQFPTWFILLCIGLGAVFALLLYFRDRTFVDHPQWTRILMSVLRFLSVTTISMLLLSPFLKLFNESTQNPVIVIGQDNSASIADAMSRDDSTAYVNALKDFREKLGDKYELQVVTVGESVHKKDTFSFNEPMTDLAQFLEYTTDQYGDQNLGAIILASDGLYNRGKNPLYVPRRTTAPVYTIALGDTTLKTDILISRVLHNRIAFLGDKFPVQVDIAANKLIGRNATVKIERIDGSQRNSVGQTTVRVEGDPWFRTEEFIIEAQQPGVLRYRASVSGVGGEEVYGNNSKDFYIEVIDGRVKILLLANSPHPDVSALHAVLQEHQNYTPTVAMINDFKGSIKDFDLVIFHQLPSARHDISAVITEMDALQKPRLFIVGEQTMLNRFNTTQPYLKIQAGQQSTNEVTALVESSFQLFTVPEDLNNQISKFAPLNAPFGQYTTDPSAQVYLWQRIGRVDTEFPLMLFGETGGVKTGIIAAEGFWRWRLHDFMQHGTHELTHALLSKTIQYVTVKDDKRRFRAAPTSNLFQDNEPITFDAELYNRSYERVTDPDVFLEVRDSEGNAYNYTFSKSGDYYTLSIGKFPVGEYRYTAFTDYDGQRQQVNGRFNVQAIELESYVTTADHRLLKSLADQYGGDIYYPQALNSLADSLLADERIKPVIYQSVVNEPIIHLRWIFLFFLVLLGLEWFMRRYLGGY